MVKKIPCAQGFLLGLAVGISLLCLGALGVLLVGVCRLRASCSVVQAKKSVCPVSCHFWVTAVCRNNIPAKKKRVFINFRKYVVFCLLIFGLFCLLHLHFMLVWYLFSTAVVWSTLLQHAVL